MSRKLRTTLLLLLGIVLIVGGLAGLTYYYDTLPRHLAEQETILLGQSALVPGSDAALRIAVRDLRDSAPVAGAEVEVRLQPVGGKAETVFTGTTTESGSTAVAFPVPETEGSYTLIVETRSKLGADRLERPVTLERDYRILLSTDKPLYQPGQVIHLRALALSTFDLRPATAAKLELIIADGKGNTVHRETLATSAFGVAATDFQLADQVNSGPYKITAHFGNTSAEKTVTVERYVLPKFDVGIETDSAYYRPGERVSGNLSAQYFFGKPVDESRVVLEGFTFDFQRNDVFTLEGTTDTAGAYTFEFRLPDYITGSNLEAGLGVFYVQAHVTDATGHSESKQLSLRVAENELIIEAIPEAGVVRPGLENLLYVLTSYPDGSPAPTDLALTFDGGTVAEATTGEYGVAVIPFETENAGASVTITAEDRQGHQSSRRFDFAADWQPEQVLLRPERPLYRVGDAMSLTVFTSEPKGTVYLDIIRDGQTVSTRAVEVTEGQTEMVIDVTPELFGTLALHAYKILPDGVIVRDTRLVLVDEADELQIVFNPDKPEYLPGDTVNVALQVEDGAGNGTTAAVGLAVVDEAVFALAEQDPGFAKLYFLLEQELLEPKYELHNFSVPQLLSGPPAIERGLRAAQEDAAQASLAEAATLATAFTLEANSRVENLARAEELRLGYFATAAQALSWAVVLLPLSMLVASSVHLIRRKQLALGAGLAFLLALALVGMATIVTALLAASYLCTDLLLLTGAMISLLGLLGVTVWSWRARDVSLALVLAGLPVWVLLVYLTGEALLRSGTLGGAQLEPLVLVALLLIALSFLLRAGGFLRERHYLPALATLTLTFVLVALLGLAGVTLAEPQTAMDMAPAALRAVEMEAAMGEPLTGMIFEVAEEAAIEAPLPAPVDEGGSSQPPRLREYFPETMFWLPNGETDPKGQMTVEIPVADSITTWRLTALASTQDGHLGSATGSLRVFQPFFVDLDLPLSLTAGDEIAVPVGIFNYLTQPQDVRLEVMPEPWFELLDEAEKELTIAANDISVVYFRIRATDFGRQPFTVTAWGSEMSDAVRKEIQVYPDGKELRFSASDALQVGEAVHETISIPVDAVPGTQSLTVKVYPGLVSQVVEGLDSLLQMPYGCFEQTSSTTYPNVLVLDYLKTSGQISPEVQFKAEDYINLGYQRLTTYEVSGGGFSLFGDAPASILLSAYGLQEFSDMSRVHNVDPALIERTAAWLMAQQGSDGSWGNDNTWVEGTFISGPQGDPVVTTAYVTWSLARAGYARETGVQTALNYLRREQDSVRDPYSLALIANALVSTDAALSQQNSVTAGVLERLASMAVLEGDTAVWPAGKDTFMGSSGDVGAMETTALAVLAFLEAGQHGDLATHGILHLVQNKDSFGNWQTTQTTILALRAFIASAKQASAEVDATVTVTLNKEQTRTLNVTAENYDVVQMITFEDVRLGNNTVQFDVEGTGNLMYQVTGSFYLPWDVLPTYPEWTEQQEAVRIDLAYDRTLLRVDDSVTVNVTVELTQPGQADWAVVDLGVPPGFAVNTEDLGALVAFYDDVPPDFAQATIERYELTGRQIILYLSNLQQGAPLQLSYRLTAQYPLRAQTPASTAYDYYNPDVNGQTAPTLLTVEG